MKILILLLLLSNSALAASTSELIVIKKENYQFMKNSYDYLAKFLVDGKITEFCKKSNSMITELYRIYEKDMELVYSLRSHKDRDFYNYSLHINENSVTDFLTLDSFQKDCKKGRAKSSLKSFSNINMNLYYLNITHQMWMNAFCPKIPGKCL